MGNSSKGQQNVNSMEMIYSGSIVVVKPANQTFKAESFMHNLGYEPVYMAYARWHLPNDPYGDQYALPYIQSEANGADAGKQQLRLNCTADALDIGCFVVTDNLAASTYYYENVVEATFYLYIFKEQILRSQ